MSKSSMFLSGMLLALSACGLEAQNNYTVTLPVDEQVNNTMAYLVNWDTAEKIDSVVVTDGVIKFTGHVGDPMISRINFGGQRGPIFFIEAGDITIDRTGIPAGTSLNDKYAADRKRMSEILTEYRSLDQNDSIQNARGVVLGNEYEAIPGKAYAANKDNMYGLYMYMQEATNLSLDKLEADMKDNPILASSGQVQGVHRLLKNQSSTGEGKHYVDFTVEYKGKKESLSDFVKPGHYTIVDFWASWCGPCVRQLKVIKELYARFKDKGLDVVGVAVWDKPEDTEKAIVSHDLPWPCIINAQTIPTDLYGIRGIPCILLINPEGIIVSRDKQGAALVKDVEEAMAKLNGTASTDIVPAAQPVKEVAQADAAAF